MNRMFAKTEKMRAATQSAMERLKAMPASDLLAFGAKHADSDLAIFLTESADDYQAEGKATVAFTHSGEYRAEASDLVRLGATEHYELLELLNSAELNSSAATAFQYSVAFTNAVAVGNVARSQLIPKFDFHKLAIMCGPMISPMLNFDTKLAA